MGYHQGKQGKSVEFGAKLGLSVMDGFMTKDTLSWEAYNESEDLVKQAEAYKVLFGHFPELIQADKFMPPITTAVGVKKTGYDSPPLQRRERFQNLLIKKPNPKENMLKEMLSKEESAMPNRPILSIKAKLSSNPPLKPGLPLLYLYSIFPELLL